MGLEEELFIDSASIFICGVCTDVSYPAVIFPCDSQHILCRDCAERLPKKICPLDNQNVSTSQLIPLHKNPFVQRLYNSLKLRCPRKCDWIGMLGDLEEHYDSSCLDSAATCDFTGCKHTTIRKDIAAHQQTCPHRIVECMHCKKGVKSIEMDAHLKDECDSITIECSRGGDRCLPIAKKLLSDHLKNDCPFETVECPWHDLGCDHSCERRLLRDHQTDLDAINSHMNLSKRMVSTLREETESTIKALRDEVSSLRGEVRTTKSVRLVCRNFSKIKGKSAHSSHFDAAGASWRLKIFPKGDNEDDGWMSVYLNCKPMLSASADWSFTRSYSVRLISSAGAAPDIVFGDSQTFSKTGGWGSSKFIKLAKLHDARLGYLVNDTLTFIVTIEKPSTPDEVSFQAE